MRRIEHLVVVGAGLIGGSFALALRKAGAVGRVTGVGRRAQTLAEAKSLGVIDEAAEGYECVARADLVMLAMPVGQTAAVLRSTARHLGRDTIVTDAGSTKCDVVAAARAELGAALPRFVPGHPIAGTEHSGPAAAFAELYRDRRVVLTPLADTDPAATARVREAWEACGARVSELGAELHDRVLATVSHLPHVLAFALVDQVAQSKDAAELFSYAAGGFRDFTRIASSHPEMWRDICLANRAALLEELGRYGTHLEQLTRALERSDGDAIEAVFARARDARNRWVRASGPKAE
jgi:prephenate dehydrogenase